MVLSVSRPFKHPKTGVYYFRKVVPEGLRAAVGRREEKVSLGTKDPVEAREKHAQVAAEVAARWARLRSGVWTELTHREAAALAGEWYRWFVALHEDEPGDDPVGWRLIADELQDAALDGIGAPDEQDDAPRSRAATSRVAAVLDRWGRLDEFLTIYGHRLAGEALQRARNAVEAEMFAALRLLARRSERDYTPDERASRFPVKGPAQPARDGLSFERLFEGWSASKTRAPKTSYTFKRVLDEFAAHLGHTDSRKVTKADVIAWRNYMLAEKLSQKTIRDSKLAPVRAIFQWAVDDQLLPANPIADVKLATDERSARRRGFRDEEATAILLAARADHRPHYRWLPWLCALSGARVAEVCQLRAEDVRKEEGIWVMHLTMDAGSLKNRGSERRVPLHPALINEGFLAFVERVKAGPLFTGIKPDRFGQRGGNGTKVISRWIREVVGIADPRVGPNHSWRHRFKSLARRYEVSTEASDALTGHKPADEGAKYGEFPLDALDRAIRKLPHPLVPDRK